MRCNKTIENFYSINHFTPLEDEIRQRRKSECLNDELKRKLKTAQETGKDEMANAEEGKDKTSN